MSQALATTSGTEVAHVGTDHLDDFVTFRVGKQLFGIPVLSVQDILTPDKIAPVPLAPPEVRGNINLRGRIVTVIDVRVRLGMGFNEREQKEEAEAESRAAAKKAEAAEGEEDKPVSSIVMKEKTKSQMGVTVENQNELYTLLVDEIGDVISVEKDRFDGNVATLDPAWREFSSGVYRLDGGLMVVFDVERLLDIKIEKQE